VTKTEFFRFLDAKSKVENDLGVYEPEKTARITGLSLEVSDSIMVNWSDLRDRWWDEWLASRHPGEAKLHKKVLQQYFNSNIKKH